MRGQCIKSSWAAKPAWEFQVTWAGPDREKKGEIRKILMANLP